MVQVVVPLTEVPLGVPVLPLTVPRDVLDDPLRTLPVQRFTVVEGPGCDVLRREGRTEALRRLPLETPVPGSGGPVAVSAVDGRPVTF